MGLFRKKETSSSLVEFIAYRNNGALFSKHERWNEAVSAYQQAIRFKPDDARVHYNLAMAHLMINDKDSALKEYRVLKDLDKDLANRLLNIITNELYSVV